MFIHTQFEIKSISQKKSIALVWDNKILTYEDLNTMANRIAHALLDEGIRPGEIVGLCLERSFEQVAGLLALMKIGAAYLPLDTEYPIDRLNFMVSHSKVTKVLSHRKFIDLFHNSDAETLIFEDLHLDSSNSSNPIIDLSKINLAYVIYTSGSTGQPKGIAMGVRPLLNLIDWQNKQGYLGEDSVTLQYTPVSFDVHFQEIFSTLTSGGRLVLISEQQRLDTLSLLKVIEENKVNKLFIPYVALNHLSEVGVKNNIYPKRLKEVIAAGEQLKISVAMRQFFEKLDGAVLYNHYGPSETHVVTSFVLNGNPHSWPNLPSIGSPIQNVIVHILDSEMNEVKRGEEGELYFGGSCLAEGYLHNEYLTKSVFIQTKKWGRIYKTGDMGYINSENNIVFMGRKDSQVKMRGHRIELGEIEFAIEKSTNGGPCVVNVIDDGQESYLCAYVNGHNTYDSNKLREELRLHLPEYMVPSYFIKINKIPLTASGKVDYKNLPALTEDRPDLNNEFEAPSSPSQLMIEKNWKSFLKVLPLGIDDNFFDLGGNSLMAIKILAEINHQVKKKISIVNFFQYPTIRSLAKFIDEKNDLLVLAPQKSETTSIHPDIAVIAINGKFPGANNVEEFWELLMTQRNPLEEFSLELVNNLIKKDFAANSHYVRIQGIYPGQEFFDYKFFGMTLQEAELMDPQQRKFLELSYHAFELAGYRPENLEGKVGIFAGMGNSKYHRLVELFPEKVANVGDFNVMLGLEKDYLASRVAYKLNLKGPAISINTGCSTSLVAIIEAVKSLRLGLCDMALAGGISIYGAPYSGHLYQTGGIFSEDGLCRSFDDRASGTLFTEGGGVVVLKRLEEAISAGDNILAVIKGVGINNDGAEKMSFTAPCELGQSLAIAEAQTDAEIKASTIGLIEAHGSGTAIGDTIEIEALTRAFERSSDQKQFCYLTSVKSNIGHLTAAAGAASFIKAILSINTGLVPGTAHFEKTNSNVRLENTPFIISRNFHQFPVLATTRRAGVSSFGVGGTNAHVILEQFPNIEPKECVVEVSESPAFFKLSAKTEEQVKELKIKLIEQLLKTPTSDWKKIAYTLDVGRKVHKVRDYVLAHDLLELEQQKNSDYRKVLNKTPRGIVLMFPGHGSQYQEMGKNLYDNIDFFREQFDLCNKLISPLLGYDIRNFLHQTNIKEDLNNTYYSQPAIFVLEYCIGKTFLELGYKIEALIGHSIGEIVAATLAEVFSLEDGLKAIVYRARLMRELRPGAMISVASEVEKVRYIMAGLEIDIAAINSARSCVLAGSFEVIEQLKIRLLASKVAFVELETSHAFHSRMMIPAVDAFKDFLLTLKLNLPKYPLYSTVTGKKEEELYREPSYWASQIELPVDFYSAFLKLKSENPNCVYVEVGTKKFLTKIVRKESRAEIENGEMNVFPLLGTKKELESRELLKALGDLWVEGLNYKKHTLIHHPRDQKRKVAPVYPFEKKLCWLGPYNDHQPRKFQNEVKTMNDERLESIKEKLSELFESSYGNAGNEDFTTLNEMANFLLTKIATAPVKIPNEFPIPTPETDPGPKPSPNPQPIPGPSPMSPGEIPGRVITPMSEMTNRELHNILSRQLELMNQQLAVIAAQTLMVKQTAVQVKNEKESEEKVIKFSGDQVHELSIKEPSHIPEFEQLTRSKIGIENEQLARETKLKIFDPTKAPAAGAKIGRDDQGNPAWFIEYPEHSGEYFVLEG